MENMDNIDEVSRKTIAKKIEEENLKKKKKKKLINI